MKYIFYVVLLLLLMPVVCGAEFTKYREINITTVGSSVPANYQMLFNITYDSDMQADFDDIRFNTSSGGVLPYWIESKVDSSYALVWVSLSDVVTHPSSGTIEVLYGDSGLSSGGVGANTFVQFHGSDSTQFFDTVVKSQPLIAEFKSRVTSATHDTRWGVTENELASPRDSANVEIYSPNNRRYFICYDGSSVVGGGGIYESPSFTVDQYYRIKIVLTDTELHAYVDDNEISTGFTSSALQNDMGLFMLQSSGTSDQEWSFIREYITNEPTYVIGAEQNIAPTFNLTINSSSMPSYYTYVDHIFLNLSTFMQDSFGVLLGPIEDLTGYIDSVNDTFNTSFDQSTGHKGIMLNILMPFLTYLPAEVHTLITFGLVASVIILVLRGNSRLKKS